MDAVTLYHVRTVAGLSIMGVALVSFLLIPRPRPVVFGIVGLITGLALVMETSSYLMSLFHRNNNFLYNLYTTTEFLLLMWMVHHERRNWRGWLLVGAAAGILAMALNAAMADPLGDLLIDGIVILSLLAALTIGALLWSMAMRSEVALHRVPAFWLCIGLLLYFSALPPVVTLASVVSRKDPALSLMLWTIMPVLNILRYLLTAYANRLQAKAPVMHG